MCNKAPKKFGERQHLECKQAKSAGQNGKAQPLFFIALSLASALTLQQNCQLPMLSFQIKPLKKHICVVKFVIWYLYKLTFGTAWFAFNFFCLLEKTLLNLCKNDTRPSHFLNIKRGHFDLFGKLLTSITSHAHRWGREEENSFL